LENFHFSVLDLDGNASLIMLIDNSAKYLSQVLKESVCRAKADVQ
jgi:hypothetical protein